MGYYSEERYPEMGYYSTTKKITLVEGNAVISTHAWFAVHLEHAVTIGVEHEIDS